jgi:hypothetical protein
MFVGLQEIILTLAIAVFFAALLAIGRRIKKG